MDANDYYLAQHQAGEVKADLKAEAIDVRAGEIFNEYFGRLGDKSVSDGGREYPEGANCYDHISAMPFSSFALIAEAVKSKDFINLGKVVYDELCKQIMKDAQYQAEKEMG